jgi:hypothetical protein
MDDISERERERPPIEKGKKNQSVESGDSFSVLEFGVF